MHRVRAKPFDYAIAAQRARDAQRALHANPRAGGPQALKLVEVFWDAWGAAFPEGFFENLELLNQRDPAAIDGAIDFLEADPYFFRSGYIKEEILHFLASMHGTFNAEQRARLQRIVLAAIDRPARREYRRYCRLASKIVDIDFIEQLSDRLASPNAHIKRNALWMLAYCDGHCGSFRE